MMKHKVLNPDEMLERIFYYMTQLQERKEFSYTITLLTELGKVLVNADRASFWFWDKQNKQYWTMAAIDNERITMEEGLGIVGASISNNEVILMNAPYDDCRFNPAVDKITGYVTKSILCIPVTNVDGEVIGAYQALNKWKNEEECGAFEEADVKRLSMAVVFCGKTLESYLVQNEAFNDQLTRLQNRKGFLRYYNTHILAAKNPVSAIVMCDIDFFKKVNDKYGHNAGDVVLKKMADILLSTIGIDDTAVRWGGEEFICILSNKTVEEAVAYAENIRKMVEQTVCSTDAGDISVTMSFGVEAIVPDDSLEHNVKRVDEKLYNSKNTGRNKVSY